MITETFVDLEPQSNGAMNCFAARKGRDGVARLLRGLMLNWIRCGLLMASFGAVVVSHAQTKAPDPTTNAVWHDLAKLSLEGKGWADSDTKHRYDRLPAKAEGVVRAPVWSLSQDSAGMRYRFV